MTHRGRVLVVGADGADPQVLSRLMADGKLPHLARLCAQGTWGPLQTTFPPVSPVAWMTCLTGVPPAVHGIRDFITKAPDSYLPTIGLFAVRVGPDDIPTYTSRCAVPTLGEMVSQAGRTAFILKVPGTFPPVSIRGGMLAGFGMPDVLGTFGVSAWYTTDEATKKASAPEGIELVQPLAPAGGGAWSGRIAGPAQTAIGFMLRRDGSQAVLQIDGRPPVAVLSPGEWSGWVRLAFAVPGRDTIPGMCRFKLVALGSVVELYRTPVECTPDAPLFPLAAPAGFGAYLESLVGAFATLGMPADLDGVRRGIVDLNTFLEDAYANWDQQIDMTLRLMLAFPKGGEPTWDLLFTHLFAVDNVQHLFAHCQDPSHPSYDPQCTVRMGDPIERAYRWLDARLGRLIEHIPSDTSVIVISDHGGLPVYRLVYLNAWLWRHGYLVPRETQPDGIGARVDWGRTRAAMFGTGGIWLNVQGREPNGVVTAGAQYEALRQEIARGLLEWRDPETGQPVIKQVLTGESVLGSGVPGSADAGVGAPDLIVALHPGYGLGRGEALGRVMLGTTLVVPNLSAWTGGHEGPYLPSDVPGLVVIHSPGSAPVDVRGAGLQDIAPTVLRLLGIARPPGIAGRSLV